MLDVTYYQGNANQKHSKIITSHLLGWLLHIFFFNVGEDVEEIGTLVYCWWEYKTVQLLMENSMEVPEQIQSQNYHMIQQSHTWIHIQKN